MCVHLVVHTKAEHTSHPCSLMLTEEANMYVCLCVCVNVCVCFYLDADRQIDTRTELASLQIFYLNILN